MEPGVRRLRVLVVEDNPGDILLIQEAVHDCDVDCALSFASTIAQAIHLAAETRFDLVISDMSISNDETAKFFEWIRAREGRKTTPIIVFSGIFDPTPAYQAGANVFVAKSADVDEFFGKIRELMHFWVHVADCLASKDGTIPPSPRSFRNSSRRARLRFSAIGN